MKLPHILYRHYHATRVNLDAVDQWPPSGDQAASNCAALHVGLDAMSRIQAKRLAAPPINPEWHGTARTGVRGAASHDAATRRVVNGAVAILARHSQRVHDARTFVGDAKASLHATTMALISVLR